MFQRWTKGLTQGSSNLSPEVQSAAEFSSNPDQTPICDFLMILKTDYHAQVCLIIVRAKLCRNGPDLRISGLTGLERHESK